MTIPIPTPGGDDESEDAVLKATEDIINSEAEQASVEGIFMLAVRVGMCLNRWYALMIDNYSREWVEETAMVMFNQYFKPFVPKWEVDDE